MQQGQQWGRRKLQCSSSVAIPPRWRAPGGQDSQHQGDVKAPVGVIPAFKSQTPEPFPAQYRLGPAQYKLEPLGSSPVQIGSYSPKHLGMRRQGVLVWFGTSSLRITELDWMTHVDPIQSRLFCDVSLVPGLISCNSSNDRSGAGHSLSMSKDGTKLRGTADILQGRDAIPRDPDSLEEWTCQNLVKVGEDPGPSS